MLQFTARPERAANVTGLRAIEIAFVARPQWGLFGNDRSGA